MRIRIIIWQMICSVSCSRWDFLGRPGVNELCFTQQTIGGATETLIGLPPLLDNLIENAVIFLSAADKYYENRFYSQEWKDALPSTSLRSGHDTHAKSYEFDDRSRLELARYKAWLKVMVGQKMRHFAISIDTMCSINVNVQTLINARTTVE